jgi:membrane protein YdbS with pleckstrin-like domain
MEPQVMFLKQHSGELLILALTTLVMLSLIIIIPQLLRANMRRVELLHQERMKSLECGLPLPREDDRPRVAGRTALIVPSIVMVTAGTVTCFLVVYKSENVFAASLAIWVVAGVVSLAAITGGAAVFAQLARLHPYAEDDDDDEVPKESSYR